MKLFPDEPAFIVGEKGFDDLDDHGQKLDVLDRKAQGQRLTDLVDRVDQPLVIALDGGWGSGKSHFLKLWCGAHVRELGGKAEVIYFDAFEHDFLDDPLVSLVSRMTSQAAAKSWSAKAIDQVKKAAFPVAKLVTRAGLAALTAGASEVATAVGDAALAKVAEASDETVKNFWHVEAGKIAAMHSFRSALADLTSPKAEGEAPRKLVFVVDELDRCRPDFALSLLEIIKHFFAVPNVNFVLGVNLAALEQLVCNRYGAGMAEASAYLQKFIHLRMALPKHHDRYGRFSSSIVYLEKLLRTGEVTDRVHTEIMNQAMYISRSHDLTLRDANRIQLELALIGPTLELQGNYLGVLISLLLMKAVSPKTYLRFMTGKANLGEIETFLGKPSEGDGHEEWLWNFWRATFGIDQPGRSYIEYLHDCRSSNRLGYVRRVFSSYLETFRPM